MASRPPVEPFFPLSLGRVRSRAYGTLSSPAALTRAATATVIDPATGHAEQIHTIGHGKIVVATPDNPGTALRPLGEAPRSSTSRTDERLEAKLAAVGLEPGEVHVFEILEEWSRTLHRLPAGSPTRGSTGVVTPGAARLASTMRVSTATRVEVEYALPPEALRASSDSSEEPSFEMGKEGILRAKLQLVEQLCGRLQEKLQERFSVVDHAVVDFAPAPLPASDGGLAAPLLASATSSPSPSPTFAIGVTVDGPVESAPLLAHAEADHTAVPVGPAPAAETPAEKKRKAAEEKRKAALLKFQEKCAEWLSEYALEIARELAGLSEEEITKLGAALSPPTERVAAGAGAAASSAAEPPIDSEIRERRERIQKIQRTYNKKIQDQLATPEGQADLAAWQAGLKEQFTYLQNHFEEFLVMPYLENLEKRLDDFSAAQGAHVHEEILKSVMRYRLQVAAAPGAMGFTATAAEASKQKWPGKVAKVAVGISSVLYGLIYGDVSDVKAIAELGAALAGVFSFCSSFANMSQIYITLAGYFEDLLKKLLRVFNTATACISERNPLRNCMWIPVIAVALGLAFLCVFTATPLASAVTAAIATFWQGASSVIGYMMWGLRTALVAKSTLGLPWFLIDKVKNIMDIFERVRNGDTPAWSALAEVACLAVGVFIAWEYSHGQFDTIGAYSASQMTALLNAWGMSQTAASWIGFIPLIALNTTFILGGAEQLAEMWKNPHWLRMAVLALVAPTGFPGVALISDKTVEAIFTAYFGAVASNYVSEMLLPWIHKKVSKDELLRHLNAFDHVTQKHQQDLIAEENLNKKLQREIGSHLKEMTRQLSVVLEGSEPGSPSLDASGAGVGTAGTVGSATSSRGDESASSVGEISMEQLALKMILELKGTGTAAVEEQIRRLLSSNLDEKALNKLLTLIKPEKAEDQVLIQHLLYFVHNPKQFPLHETILNKLWSKTGSGERPAEHPIKALLIGHAEVVTTYLSSRSTEIREELDKLPILLSFNKQFIEALEAKAVAPAVLKRPGEAVDTVLGGVFNAAGTATSVVAGAAISAVRTTTSFFACGATAPVVAGLEYDV